ncbi:mucin-5AC-like [Melitaea cinxia]|uniref:mucin-5AC-like n=1 Tax=Melitaea cinxia TaxID=113334 RepID=UPI001E274237|nr:mucin-5AC-like [Melitaea cinxia]
MNLLIILACVTTAIATNATETVTSTEPPKNSTKEILTASETADPTKVEIVKQIRRLNEDGSYTIGYEANDGTFKIESRDVLGNVKGTFGYIDDDGEIKRVTYSSSGDSTPVPVSTSTTSSTPTMIVRVNKTVSSTTRRPLATVVYPTRSSATTRGTVIQPIPRRRPASSTTRITTETSTEKHIHDETTADTLNSHRKEDVIKTRTQLSKPVPVTVKDDLITKQTTTTSPQTLKPVYEHVTENEPDVNKSNTIRRELPGTSSNHHMVSLQQSMGDDSTDVYGGHLSHGTVRPLFTTTTARPRILPIHSLLAARQKIQQQYQETQLDDQETTLEASTGRVFNHENAVTSNPVPVIHIPAQRPPEERVYQHPIYHRPSAIHFRTQEYLRDNPGAPIPIGNQRPFLQYEYQDKVLDPQYVKEPSQSKASSVQDAAYELRPVPRIVQIPVDERGIPIQGYEPRFVNPYRPQPLFQRYDPVSDTNSIQAPVSTRDFKRLLHILIMRQNRLQAIMDQIMPGPLYQSPSYRHEAYQQHRRYQDEDRYDYRYDPQYRQDQQQEVYSNQVSSYEDPQYESQRYVPRRRYSRPYDSQGSASNHIDEPVEYLPVEVREALLLKMLLLAISPDYMPTTPPATELTTAAPTRKQVRNVQILGEENTKSTQTTKRNR